MAKAELSSIVASDVAKRTIYVDPSLLIFEGNPRFDQGDLGEIEQSMITEGFYPHKPLLVKRVGEKLRVVDGGRRGTAVQNLLKKGHTFPDGIPVAVADKNLTEAQLRVMAYTANNSKSFLPLEEAALFKKMRDGDEGVTGSGMTIKQIHERTGKSTVHINKALALIESDASVQEAVKDGSVSATLGKAVAVKARGDKAKQKELIDRAKQSGKKGQKALAEEVERTQGRRRLNKPQVLKALGPAQIGELEAKQSLKFANAFKSLGYESMEAVRLEISKDDSLTLAFLMGTALALQAVRGNKVNLEV